MPTPHYTLEQIGQMNAGLPGHMRASEQLARNIGIYSRAAFEPKRKRAKKEPPAARVNNASSRAIYDGAELQRLCVRPGAYTAIDLPSLRNGQRIAPQAPFCSP